MKIGSYNIRVLQRLIYAATMLCALCLAGGDLYAQQTICATVKVEIQQTFAFERQAFDAKMLITNGLSEQPVENVAIAVNFTDEYGNPVLATSDPNNETAKFFIVVSSMSGIADVSGSGTIEPASVAEVHWLIIPAPSAANGILSGKLYFVGATVQYTINGEAKVFEAAEDFIIVKPQPQLELDYFIPKDVYGDDPLTQPIETPIPFTLGVRVKNVGIAPANNATIESAQPQIVENLQGLLISFEIFSSFVDNAPAMPTLLLNFGDIAAASARAGRWLMETTLSGKFVSFGATFTHDDGLGGALTSLVTQVHTHTLIKDVLVDLPGRDPVLDFLANSNGILKVFESHGLDSLVTDQSALVTLVPNGSSGGVDHYYIDVPNTAGMLYLTVPDPYNGSKAVQGASRADGKVLPLSNVWFGRTGMTPSIVYTLRLFDVNGGGRYFIDVGTPIVPPGPPVVLFLPNYSMPAGGRLSFLVFGNNPAGPSPQMSVDSLPLGATFTNFAPGGVGLFDWPTTKSQVGNYPVTFRATANGLSGARTPTLKVTAGLPGDSDSDGMPDDWEISNFGTLNRDGTLDLDGDGLTDLEEYQLGLDPTSQANAPSVPVIASPLDGQTVSVLRPTLLLKNSAHGVQIPNYQFQLSTDPHFENVRTATVPESTTGGVSGWQLADDLIENAIYYWRARASLAVVSSEWVYGEFRISQLNELPPNPVQVYPLDGEVVDSNETHLTVANVVDPDGDKLTYQFVVLDSSEPTPQVHSIGEIPGGSNGFTSIVTTIPQGFVAPFRWRGIAVDSSNVPTAGPYVTFRVLRKGEAPSPPLPLKPIADSIVIQGETQKLSLVAKHAYDPDTAHPSPYLFELSSDPQFSTILQSTTVKGGNTITKCKVNDLLPENKRYYWRVRAADDLFIGRWAYASFIVNSANEAPGIPAATNPELDARVDSLTPSLSNFEGVDPDPRESDLKPLMYQFQVYADVAMTQVIAEGNAEVPFWKVTPALQNHTTYYWRSRTRDSAGLTSEWSTARSFFVSKDLVDDPPTVQMLIPNCLNAITTDSELLLHWADADPDSNAALSLILNSTTVPAFEFTEALDGKNDFATLPPFTFAPGVYKLRIRASDDTTTVDGDGGCEFTVLPQSLTKDSDGDKVPDYTDNCPYIGNPDQRDSGGLQSSARDGIGDRCQCGDFSGDGRVDQQDLKLLGLALKARTRNGLPHLELCNMTGNIACDGADYLEMRKHMKRKRATKRNARLPQVCEAARG